MKKIGYILGIFVALTVFSVVFSFFIANMVAHDARVSSSSVHDNKSSGEVAKERVDDNIKIEVYQPTRFDTKSNAPYYVIISNVGSDIIYGSFKLSDVDTVRETDKVGMLNLDPHEVKVIAGKGELPNEAQINLSFQREESNMPQKSKREFNIDPSLNYKIIEKKVTDGGTLLSVYVAPNEKDETYLAISKEIKENYSSKLIIADFSPVMVNPEKNDVRVVFARNTVLGFSHVLFYSDATNTEFQENERRKVNI